MGLSLKTLGVLQAITTVHISLSSALAPVATECHGEGLS